MEMKICVPAATALGLAIAMSANAGMTGNAFENGYAYSGTDFGGVAVSGYVVDLYLEFDSDADVMLNVYNFNDVNLGTEAYFQGLTAPGWAPNEQGSIFQTDVSQNFDSFIAIGGVQADGANGPIQMAGNGVSVDPNFGGNSAIAPAADAGWYNGNPNNPIGQVVATNFTTTGFGVFIGRFSIENSAGFSMIGSDGFATYNQGVGTPGVQTSFNVVDIPAPGALALLGLAGLASRRRR
jgi:hypothetical protein